MSNTVVPPSFYFTVDHLESLYPRWENGRWRPSRKKENHTIVASTQRSRRAYYYDGLTQRAGSELVRVVGSPTPTQCYSLYKDTTNGVWIVDHDATEEMMGDGQDLNTLPDDDEEVNNDWSRLTFRKSLLSATGGVRCSYAAYGQPYDHLQYGNGNTVTGWMQHLLPSSCHAGRSTERCDTPHGLIGELALLIGLLALSLPTIHMKQLLPTLLQRQWRWPTTNFYSPIYRPAGVTGVRIQLWLAHAPPNGDQTSNAVFASLNNERRLIFFQEGGCGPIIGGF